MFTHPMPPLRGEEAIYHRHLRQGRFVVQQCTGCESYIYYPRVVCPHCGSEDLEYRESAGRGTVYTFTVCHRPGHPSFADQVPYVVAMVELEEGVHIGMPVEVELRPVDDEAAVAVFRPRTGGDA